MTEHASSHLIGDDYRPINSEETMRYAILIELRALNAHLAAQPVSSPAAPRRDGPSPAHATAAPPVPRKTRK